MTWKNPLKKTWTYYFFSKRTSYEFNVHNSNYIERKIDYFLLVSFLSSFTSSFWTQKMACAELTVSENIFLQQNIFQAIAQIRSNNKRPDLKGIHSYLVKIEKLKELSIQYLQQIVLQLEDEGKLVNKKFKGADSFFTTETKSIANPPQSPDPFFSVTQDTPLTTPSPDQISNLQTELHELRTEVAAMKSFISERFLLIKQNQKLVNEQSISDCENNSELTKSLEGKFLRENSVKSNMISSLINNKVLFNNAEKSNNFVSTNRFSCLNNYEQFENNVDFNKEIAHVTPSNILTTSKDSTDISHSKECSKEPIRDQITSSQHSTSPNISSNQEHSKEPIRGRKIKTNKPNAPTTTIIGDSVIKKVFDDKLSRQFNYKHHVVLRSFSGAKTQCMEHYIKPNVKLSPKQKILHCGTNNLPSSEDPETIAKNIINIAKNIKADTVKVAISGIILRRDTFNLKAKQVYETLKKIYEEEKIPFISHHGMNTRFHLNSCGLHLNDKGATRLAQNFKRFLSDTEFG